MGCEEGQGYFFGKSMPAGDFENRLMIAQEAALAG
jgi:EAL domain-containing protein (putative c-di-GMP-specific phosphodiesterase class I)